MSGFTVLGAKRILKAEAEAQASAEAFRAEEAAKAAAAARADAMRDAEAQTRVARRTPVQAPPPPPPLRQSSAARLPSQRASSGRIAQARPGADDFSVPDAKPGSLDWHTLRIAAADLGLTMDEFKLRLATGRIEGEDGKPLRCRAWLYADGRAGSPPRTQTGRVGPKKSG